MPDVDVVPASRAYEPVLRHLMELYLHDFSEINGLDVDADGRSGTRTSTAPGSTPIAILARPNSGGERFPCPIPRM